MRSTVILKMITMDFLLDLDRVIIMENGRIKEQGPPQRLLMQKNSELSKEVKEVDEKVMKKFNSKVLLGKEKWNDLSEKNQKGWDSLLSQILKKKKDSK